MTNNKHSKMKLFPVARYLGENETSEHEKGSTNTNLETLLSKVKHREKLQKNANPNRKHVNISSKGEKGDKILTKKQKKYETQASYSEVNKDEYHSNILLDHIQRLKVDDKGKNNNDNYINSSLEEQTNLPKSDSFQIIGDIKFKKKTKVKRFLPDWLANPSVVSVNLKHLELTINDIPELNSVFVNTLKNNNITHFFPVQAQVIPWILGPGSQSSLLPPGDVCVSAPTGSGKTLAYAIPILQELMGRKVGQIQALVVLPVQDLATQVAGVLKNYSANTGLKVHLSSGALPLPEDRTQLLKHRTCVGWESQVDVLVVTPGRLVEHLYTTPGFTLKYLRYIVIDEADRVIDSHQDNWLYHLDLHLATHSNTLVTVENMRTAPRRPQKLLFSATLSSDPEKLNHLHLFQPRLFTSVVEASTSTSQREFVGELSLPAELRQYIVRCVLAVKPLVLFHLVTRPGWCRVLVFVSSGRAAHQLAALLTLLSQHTQHTLQIAEVSAQCSPQRRQTLLADFAMGRIDVLISTDQFARGMDIPDVQYVVSYDMPKYVKAYIHRVGRTGRAGHEGQAVTLVTHSQVGMFNQMLRNTGILENVNEIKVEEQDLKILEEPFKNSLRMLKSTKEEEESKNANNMKLSKRGSSIKVSLKRKRKKGQEHNTCKKVK